MVEKGIRKSVQKWYTFLHHKQLRLCIVCQMMISFFSKCQTSGNLSILTFEENTQENEQN